MIAQELVLLHTGVLAMKRKTENDKLQSNEMATILQHAEFLLNRATELDLTRIFHPPV